MMMQRRHSLVVRVGSCVVGGDAPVSVQSMTNTPTSDVVATVAQIKQLEQAGADIVRISVPDSACVAAFTAIRQQVDIPLVADIHFDHSIALEVAKVGADCLRINPGNIGSERKITEVIQCAKHLDIPIRIGVNAGSLEKDLQRKYGEPTAAALVESAMRHVSILQRHKFAHFKVSVKASDVAMSVDAYTALAKEIEQPLHLGITESGGIRNGAVRSAIGIGMLLARGIGDTIRVSLAADPVEEVKVGWDMLKALKLRSRGVNLIACPSCSRQNFDVIGTVNALEQRFEDIVDPIDIAIIGCYVNGPGESREVALGVTGGPKDNLIFSDGKPADRVSNAALLDTFEAMVRKKIHGGSAPNV